MTRNYAGIRAGEGAEKIMASVVIYTRQFCGYCSAAKALLETKGVDFRRA